MFKSVYIILLSCFITCSVYAQDSISYKNKVDSILISRSKVPAKKKTLRLYTLRVRYFISRKTGELYLIEVAEQKGKELVIYNYHYIDDELTMISKHQSLPHKDIRIEKVFYYFKNNSLFFKVGNSAPIDDLNYHVQYAQKLKANAPSN